MTFKSKFHGGKMSPLSKFFDSITTLFIEKLEEFFYRLGYGVAKRPWLTIISSLVVCVACSGGMFMWINNTDDQFLWTPYGSDFGYERVWIEDHFPKDTRYETIIFSADNVLQASYVRYLLSIDSKVKSLRSKTYNNTFEDLCIRNWEYDSRLRDGILKPGSCVSASILALWQGNEDAILGLDDRELIELVSILTYPQSLNYEEQFARLFSGLVFNETSEMAISANAMMALWLVRQANSTRNEGGEIIDKVAMDWETEFIDQIITNEVAGRPPGLKVSGLAEKSFDEGIDGSVNSNLQMLFIGFVLIFAYVSAVLGKWNVVEQRVFISIMGILVIGLALGASFGLCFYLKIFFANMHPIIPFLLLGVGVDDVFVIVQTLDNLQLGEKKAEVPERIALAMKHAGVSITVTSITDMAAFLIGSTTSMPILRAFCLFAAMGVLFLYLFAITFFIGCLTLDEIRIDERKVCNFGCFGRKPDVWVPSEFSQRHFGQEFCKKYLANFILKPVVSVILVIITLVAFGFGVYGVTQIETDYDAFLYLDKGSYQSNYFTVLNEYFPESGERVEVYVGDIEYWKFSEELLKIDKILMSSQYVSSRSVIFWYSSFYESKHFNKSCHEEECFKLSLNSYLCNEGLSVFEDLKLSISPQELCKNTSETNYTIIASRAKFQHGLLPSTEIRNRAMNEIRSGMEGIIFSGEEFHNPIAYSFMYIQWEANSVISSELIRNLSITFGTITIVTLIMVANFQTSVLVLVSVLFTVVNVWGYAYYMGLTIEIATSIILILSVGLALDYSAHIAVSFVCTKGSNRKEKVKETLATMGPAVFNGGFSTFLAFLLLAWTEAYAFSTFFKMFSLVVLFGLFHGLVFMPILLSVVGPVSKEKSGSDIEKAAIPPTIQEQLRY